MGNFSLLLQGVEEKNVSGCGDGITQPHWVMEHSPKIHHCLGLKSPAGELGVTFWRADETLH